MHMCSMRYPLEATQLEDVEVPQLPAPRFAVLEPSVQLGRPTGGPRSSRAFCGTGHNRRRSHTYTGVTLSSFGVQTYLLAEKSPDLST